MNSITCVYTLLTGYTPVVMQITFCCFVSHCSVAQNENSNNSSRHWRSIAFDIFAPPAKRRRVIAAGEGVRRGMVSCRLGLVVVMAMAMAMASSRPQTAESVVAFVVHPRRQQQLLLVAGSCCNGNCNCNSSNGNSSSYTFAPTCCRC